MSNGDRLLLAVWAMFTGLFALLSIKEPTFASLVIFMAMIYLWFLVDMVIYYLTGKGKEQG